MLARSRILIAVPQTQQAAFEIAKAIHELVGQTDNQNPAHCLLEKGNEGYAWKVSDNIWQELYDVGFFDKYGYNPEEPRIPKYHAGGGRWTYGAQFAQAGTDDAASILRRRGGHHFVPRAVYKDLPLKRETRKIFDDARTGRLKAAQHGWSVEHGLYNQAVAEALKQFTERNNIKLEYMTPGEAQQFVYEVIGSGDPRIRELNLRIYRREILYYIQRHMPLNEIFEGREGSDVD